MASDVKTTVKTPGGAVYLAFAIHVYAWAGVSVILILANAISLFLPPWCIIPIASWLLTGVAIHGIVTYFVVNQLGGNFKHLTDVYIWRLIPKEVKDTVAAKLNKDL